MPTPIDKQREALPLQPGLTFLVVEDDPANLMLVRAVLERGGHHVDAATSADEAEERLRDHRPDVILMDIRLPGRDGLSLTRQLKSAPATRQIPIVALTAHAMREDRERALAAGCDGYITKPIATRTLQQEIAEILERQRRARSDEAPDG